MRTDLSPRVQIILNAISLPSCILSHGTSLARSSHEVGSHLCDIERVFSTTALTSKVPFLPAHLNPENLTSWERQMNL